MDEPLSYRCEHCEGTVMPKRIDREAFKHRQGFVILENVVIGVCDRCGSRSYSAETLHRVQAVATGQVAASRFESVPVGVAR
jgi:YgiT-type zinc finger domain-containing protein